VDSQEQERSPQQVPPVLEHQNGTNVAIPGSLSRQKLESSYRPVVNAIIGPSIKNLSIFPKAFISRALLHLENFVCPGLCLRPRISFLHFSGIHRRFIVESAF